MKTICKRDENQFAGALLRPHSWVVEKMPEDIVKSTYDAGYELITNGQIKESDLDNISRNLVSLEEYMKL